MPKLEGINTRKHQETIEFSNITYP